MKTKVDLMNERNGVKPEPHELVARRGGGPGCSSCVFSEGHPVHHHVAPVISLFSDRRSRR